jgi:hypothetical protein
MDKNIKSLFVLIQNTSKENVIEAVNILEKFISSLICSSSLSMDILADITRYFCYIDILCVTLTTISKLLDERLNKRVKSNPNDLVTDELFLRNCLAFLLQLRLSDKNSTSVFLLSQKKSRKNDDMPHLLAKCWLLFLRFPLPSTVVKQVLLFLEANVLPHVPSPLLFTGFFLTYLSKGGFNALLALGGWNFNIDIIYIYIYVN